MLNIFKNSPDAKKSHESYSKGIGIFCLRQQGIKMNEYITGYFGEIYSPWLWFEKQDLIKSKKLDNDLPDFYNIMLERHKNDKDGYNLVMVDPNSKGNFASRMSHSCNPNCNTVLMVSGDKYTIGMFATKNISFGEELTFDYNSVTEKEKEFKDAICLCSEFSCRGHYLILSKSIVLTDVLDLYHNFLHRNAILLYACFFHDDLYLNEKEKNLLEKYSIKNSILKNAPFWLKKWCVMILTFIDLESKLLPFVLYKKSNQQDFKNEKITYKIKKFKEKNLEIDNFGINLNNCNHFEKKFNNSNYNYEDKIKNISDQKVDKKECYSHEFEINSKFNELMKKKINENLNNKIDLNKCNYFEGNKNNSNNLDLKEKEIFFKKKKICDKNNFMDSYSDTYASTSYKNLNNSYNKSQNGNLNKTIKEQKNSFTTFLTKQKHNFNNENYYYEGKGKYKSSTRGKNLNDSSIIVNNFEENNFEIKKNSNVLNLVEIQENNINIYPNEEKIDIDSKIYEILNANNKINENIFQEEKIEKYSFMEGYENDINIKLENFDNFSDKNYILHNGKNEQVK